MRMMRVMMIGNPIKKTYLLKDLLDPFSEIKKRIQLIESISNKLDFIPKTKIQIEGSSLVYIQDHIFRERIEGLNNSDKLRHLKNFAKNLDCLSDTGFVHGDIHKLNVIFDGSKINLIDLEPSFKQKKHNKNVTMCSAPKRSLKDIQNKTISLETDKIGYYLFCYKFFDIKYFKIPIKYILAKRKKENWEFLPLEEKEFVKLSYIDIYNLFSKEQNKL